MACWSVGVALGSRGCQQRVCGGETKRCWRGWLQTRGGGYCVFIRSRGEDRGPLIRILVQAVAPQKPSAACALTGRGSWGRQGLRTGTCRGLPETRRASSGYSTLLKGDGLFIWYTPVLAMLSRIRLTISSLLLSSRHLQVHFTSHHCPPLQLSPPPPTKSPNPASQAPCLPFSQ